MNELIAMWEARANSENDPKVSLAIMQCVGELKASQEHEQNYERAWVYECGEDHKGGYMKLAIGSKSYSIDGMVQNNDKTAIQLLRKVKP